ncbi:MAG: hypothetical protein FJ194_08830 [Gammaproteobacteria bacterium]|nr:hypothetical protein [Gammaproteobacteria bacterium]
MSSTVSGRQVRLWLVCTFSFLLTACGGSGGGSDGPSQFSGSVGDGPVVDADITVYDADGQVVQTGMATDTATYRLEVPGSAKRPLRVVATGGTDLVTGRPVEFELVSVVTGTAAQTLNLSPMSSLISHVASCGNKLDGAALDAAWNKVQAALSMGLDTSKIAHPVSTKVTATNVDTVLLANEALGETIRRTHTALSNSGDDLTHDELLRKLACDLVDGKLDGAGGSGADARLTSTFRAAEVGVLIETIAGRLEVDGRDAMGLLDESIRAIMPDAPEASVENVKPTAALIDQTKKAIGVVRGAVGGSPFVTVSEALDSGNAEAVQAAVDRVYSPAVQDSVEAAKAAVALADQSKIDELKERMVQQAQTATPTISLSITPLTVNPNQTTLLSIATANAESCHASGGWSGEKPLTGAHHTGALESTTRFTLVCTGVGGSTSRSVDVVVGNPNTPAPPTNTTPPPVTQPPAPTPAPQTSPVPVFMSGR